MLFKARLFLIYHEWIFCFKYMNNRLKTSWIGAFLFNLLAILIFVQTAACGEPDSLEILFVANVNGAYENCHCGTDPLGGVDRLATLIKEFREQNKNLLFIDGGDFFNPYPYPELNQLIFDMYQLLAPQIIVLADNELQDGNESFLKSFSTVKSVILNSNVRFSGQFDRKTPVFIKTIGQRKIAVLSFIDQSSFRFKKKITGVELNEHSFKKTLQKVSPKVDFKIIIFHGEDYALPSFLKKYKQIDLILLGHSQTPVEKIQQHPAIVGAGADSEYLVRLQIKFLSSKKQKIDIQRIPVSLQVKPSSEYAPLIRTFKEKGFE